MKNKVIKAIKQYSMLGGATHVTVALSGGADSMALLYVLNEIKDKYGFSLSAAHLNHCIRGEEADRDEAFVKAQCKKLNIPIICEKRDIPCIAAATGQSTELAARNERYRFLNCVCKGVIATAHTASDNAETVLFNLARGTSLRGLCGIPKSRDNIIRPLILCTRHDIEDYCLENGIEYCNDSTNSDIKYSRNRIRHLVLPELRKINPGLDEKISSTCELIKQDEDYLTLVARQEFEKRFNDHVLSLKGVKGIHSAILRRVLVMFLKSETGVEVQSHFIKDMENICTQGGRCDLKNGFYAVASGGKLKILATKDDSGKTAFEFQVDINNLTCGYDLVEFKHLNIKDFKNVNKKLLINALDCDKIIGNLVVRNRISGDSIELLGRKCRKSLKKLFIEAKIPSFDRSSIPVLADERGIVWVSGFGIDERVKVDKNTKRVILINLLLGGEL